MWDLISGKFTNLFSHENTEFVVKQNELTGVFGANLDDSGADSNGSGKSTLMEAITLGITGDVFRKIKKDDFINKNHNDCTVSLVFKNSVLKSTMEITRVFHRTKSSKVIIVYNGVERNDIENKDKFILDEIGIAEDDLLNYFVIGQGNYNSFFSSTDAKQKEIIARFSNYNQIDFIISTIKKEVASKQSDIQQHKLQRERFVGKLETVNDSIENINETFEQEKNKKIARIQQQINDDEQLMVVVKENMKKGSASIVQLQNKIDTLSESLLKNNATKYKANKRQFKEILDSFEEKKTELVKATTKLTLQLEKEIICPACSHRFFLNSEQKPEQIRLKIVDLKKDIQEVDSDIKIIEQKIKLVIEKIKQFELKEDELSELKDSHKKITNQLSIYKNKLRSFSENISENTNQLDNLRNKTADEELKELKKKRALIKDDISQENKCIDKLEKEAIENNELLYHLDRTGFKTFIANLSIKTIQDICNFYLNRFETNLQIEISGFKVLKNGEVRDKIEISVMRNGISEGLFNKFSGGEKSRMDLCGILAINNMINNNCEYGKGLNLLCLDEKIGGLDATGQDEIIKILQKSNITSMLVMHHIENKHLKNKIKVEKKNEVSKIVLNESL